VLIHFRFGFGSQGGKEGNHVLKKNSKDEGRRGKEGERKGSLGSPLKRADSINML